MATSILRKEDLPVDEISANIRSLTSNIKSSSIKNLRFLSQGLTLSNQLDKEESQLDEKQRKIDAEKMSGTTQVLDRYQDGYNAGVVKGIQTGFTKGFKDGVEYGQKSVLEDIIESLSGKAPALIATVLGALGFEMLKDYIIPEEQPTGQQYGPGQPMEGNLVTGQGGGTPFHIDTRFARDLPIEQQVLIFDSMAKQLEAEGRVAEMGEAGAMSGKRYPVNGTMQEKINFLKKAQAGHHTQREMAAMDYFIPKKEETRFGPSAEYAPIPAPEVPGYRVEYFRDKQMAGYVIIDEKTGKVVGKTLHGDPKFSTLKPIEPKTYPSVSPKIIEDTIIEPVSKEKKVSSLMQDMEPKGMIVAFQPIQSQTVVNNQRGNGGGIVVVSNGTSDDSRISGIIALAKRIS